MTDRPSSDHLIERAARRLQESKDDVAAVLLNGPSAGARRGPGSESVPGLGNGLDASQATYRPRVDHANRDHANLDHVDREHARPDRAPDFARPTSTHSGAPLDADTLARAGMIDWRANRERLSEEFRIVQAQVLQAMAAKPAKEPALSNVIMLTSAKPGEGKTFSSLNLAGSLASCGQQPVILVDVDVKRHSMTSRLMLQNRMGLLNLAGQSSLHFSDCLIDTPVQNLSVIPIGQPSTQEAAVGGKPIIKVIERLGRSYPDCIIVLDTPPCLSSSEPSTLAPVVGHIVMLIEAQQTQRAEVEAALDLIEACPSVVLMLNKVQLTGSDTFGAYGY